MLRSLAFSAVKATCDLAAALDLEVIAEGVETAEPASSALAAGCKVLQGFWCAHPLEAGAAAAWLRARSPGQRDQRSGAEAAPPASSSSTAFCTAR